MKPKPEINVLISDFCCFDSDPTGLFATLGKDKSCVAAQFCSL